MTGRCSLAGSHSLTGHQELEHHHWHDRDSDDRDSEPEAHQVTGLRVGTGYLVRTGSEPVRTKYRPVQEMNKSTDPYIPVRTTE